MRQPTQSICCRNGVQFNFSKPGFILNCSSNFGSQPRRDWFYVNAGGKEVKIFVMQMGKEDAVSDKPILPATPKVAKDQLF